MSGILHKLNHYLKELNRFTFPSNIQNHNEYISDQLSCIALKKNLERAIGNKEDDFAISHVDLLALSVQKHFFNTALNEHANNIVQECNSTIAERAALLKAILDLIFHCKVAMDVSFVDRDKVTSKLSAVFKKLFKQTEHFKADDIIAFVHVTDTKTLYAALNKFTFFSNEQFKEYTQKQLQASVEKLEDLTKAKKSISPQRIIAIPFASSLRGLTQFATTSSAPNSPVTANEDVGIARSRSLPDAAKAKSAATQIMENFTVPGPQASRTERSLSESPFAIFPEEFLERTRLSDSTASTLFPLNAERLPEMIFNLKLGPSSKSEDESDDRKTTQMKEEASKEKIEHRKRHSSKKK